MNGIYYYISALIAIYDAPVLLSKKAHASPRVNPDATVALINAVFLVIYEKVTLVVETFDPEPVCTKKAVTVDVDIEGAILLTLYVKINLPLVVELEYPATKKLYCSSAFMVSK